MKKGLKVFSVLLAVLMCILALAGCAKGGKVTPTATADPNVTAAPTAPPPDIDPSTVDYTIPVWNALEITFESSKEYETVPFYDVSFDVTFTAPDGTTMIMPGFWDGGTAWKVRFAPTKCGVWTYKTACTDSENTGLNGKEGKIGCNAYKGDLAIYKHGFIKTQPDTRYFMYADGTPFFYLGDTHWGMPFERFEGSNVEGVDSQFKYVVDKRIEQGFTVYQSEPIQAANKYGDKIYTLNRFTKSVLNGFVNMDRKFKYIADKGMVHANAQLFFGSEMSNPSLKKYYTDEYLDKLSRYWVARYAAYPVLWTTAQEVDDTMYEAYQRETNPWKVVIESVHKYDPYKHPSTAHQENTGEILASTSGFKDLASHKWFGAQWSPKKDGPQDFKVPKDYWNNSGRKPVVNYEGHYDHFWTGTFGARMQGWTAYLNGMFGQGYGAAGNWLLINDYSKRDYAGSYDLDKDTGTNPETTKEMKRMNWYEGVQLPAATHLGTHMRKFFEAMEWWKLIPCFDDPQAEHIGIYSAWFTAATIENKTYVVYFYNKDTTTGKLTNLEKDKTYTAKWFNPRTGEYTDIGSDIKGAEEKSLWKMPDKPDGEDWVLYATINK